MNWILEIKNYKPCNEQESKDKEVILNCVDRFKDVLTRKNEIAHITSSSFIVNKNRDKVLMVHHNIYNSWSWTGGHADGDEDLLAVAIKESQEEAGINKVLPIKSDIFSLDVLHVVPHIKRGKYISAHLHLNVTYLLEADEEEKLTIKKDENSGVKWIPINEVNNYSNEPHMQKVYGKLIEKIKALKN